MQCNEDNFLQFKFGRCWIKSKLVVFYYLFISANFPCFFWTLLFSLCAYQTMLMVVIKEEKLIKECVSDIMSFQSAIKWKWNGLEMEINYGACNFVKQKGEIKQTQHRVEDNNAFRCVKNLIGFLVYIRNAATEGLKRIWKAILWWFYCALDCSGIYTLIILKELNCNNVWRLKALIRY